MWLLRILRQERGADEEVERLGKYPSLWELTLDAYENRRALPRGVRAAEFLSGRSLGGVSAPAEGTPLYGEISEEDLAFLRRLGAGWE